MVSSTIRGGSGWGGERVGGGKDETRQDDHFPFCLNMFTEMLWPRSTWRKEFFLISRSPSVCREHKGICSSGDGTGCNCAQDFVSVTVSLYRYTHGGGVVVVVVFSSLARIFGKCSTIRSPPALFSLRGWGLGCGAKMEISSRAPISLFMAGSVHGGSASWDDCGRMFLDELRVSSFPDRFPHYAWTVA